MNKIFKKVLLLSLISSSSLMIVSCGSDGGGSPGPTTPLVPAILNINGNYINTSSPVVISTVTGGSLTNQVFAVVNDSNEKVKIDSVNVTNNTSGTGITFSPSVTSKLSSTEISCYDGSGFVSLDSGESCILTAKSLFNSGAGSKDGVYPGGLLQVIASGATSGILQTTTLNKFSFVDESQLDTNLELESKISFSAGNKVKFDFKNKASTDIQNIKIDLSNLQTAVYDAIVTSGAAPLIISGSINEKIITLDSFVSSIKAGETQSLSFTMTSGSSTQGILGTASANLSQNIGLDSTNPAIVISSDNSRLADGKGGISGNAINEIKVISHDVEVSPENIDVNLPGTYTQEITNYTTNAITLDLATTAMNTNFSGVSLNSTDTNCAASLTAESSCTMSYIVANDAYVSGATSGVLMNFSNTLVSTMGIPDSSLSFDSSPLTVGNESGAPVVPVKITNTGNFNLSFSTGSTLDTAFATNDTGILVTTTGITNTPKCNIANDIAVGSSCYIGLISSGASSVVGKSLTANKLKFNNLKDNVTKTFDVADLSAPTFSTTSSQISPNLSKILVSYQSSSASTASGTFSAKLGKSIVADGEFEIYSGAGNWGPDVIANESCFNSTVGTTAVNSETMNIGDSCDIYIKGTGGSVTADYTDVLTLAGVSGDTTLSNTYNLTSKQVVYAGGTGEIIKSYNNTTFTDLPDTASFTFNGDIEDLATDDFGNLYATGNSTVTGISGSNPRFVAKYDGVSWSYVGTPVAAVSGDAFDSTLYTLVVSADGSTIYTAGYMEVVNEWNGTSWSVLSGGPSGKQFNGTIYALHLDVNGDLFVGARYSLSGNQEYLAKYSDSAWSFVSESATITGEDNPVDFNGDIRTFATSDSGNLLFAGNFAKNTSDRYLAKLDGTTVNGYLNTNPNYMNGKINSIVSVGSDVYIGGNLTGSTTGSERKIVKATSNGAGYDFSQIANGAAFQSAITSMAVDNAGMMFIGGWKNNNISSFDTTSGVALSFTDNETGDLDDLKTVVIGDKTTAVKVV